MTRLRLSKPDLARHLSQYQSAVTNWCKNCFGEQTASDVNERCYRFLEESLELCQSLGVTSGEAKELVNYVYGRPEGVPHQELGGVMVTLAALCAAQQLNLGLAAVDELDRVNSDEVIEAIRAKHESKPCRSPLPGDFKYSKPVGPIFYSVESPRCSRVLPDENAADDKTFTQISEAVAFKHRNPNVSYTLKPEGVIVSVRVGHVFISHVVSFNDLKAGSQFHLCDIAKDILDGKFNVDPKRTKA